MCKSWLCKESIFANERLVTPDVVADETWFSDTNFCEKLKDWYALAKTLAEEGAWKFAKENGIDLVTINPGVVIGPALQSTLNITVKNILNQVITYVRKIYKCANEKPQVPTHQVSKEKAKSLGVKFITPLERPEEHRNQESSSHHHHEQTTEPQWKLPPEQQPRLKAPPGQQQYVKSSPGYQPQYPRPAQSMNHSPL
ncbi:hypothetical protein F8388_022508 [Cannabis sativa]|uniref:Uncharacterized protein n=1 Tax=Cannabis sativa TaxID=3483 RepID=A0A7J6EWQ6_CANSA|nr:hypothetical protein F8388_022508 [Cannabis sativa]